MNAPHQDLTALPAAYHAQKTFPKDAPPTPAAADVEAARPRACDECGQTDAYHPIVILGIEISSTMPFLCSACSRKAEDDAEAQAHQELLAARKAHWESTIPSEYRATSLQHPEFNSRVWEAIRNHPYQTRNLGLVGNPGLCKTRFLALFAKRAIGAGINVGWANTYDIEEAGRMRGNHRQATEARALIHHWKRARILFLDDLGKSRWSANLEALLFEILEARYGAGRVTHWSLNPQPDDANAPITTELLADALDPEGTAARRNHFAPILSRLQDNTLIVPVRKTNASRLAPADNETPNP